MCARVLRLFSHVPMSLTLCDPTGCSLPGSSVHGILQARMLKWAAMTSSRESSPPMSPALQVDSLPLNPWGSMDNTKKGKISVISSKVPGRFTRLVLF